MLGGWRLVLRRGAGQRTVVAAVVAMVLLAATLASVVAAYTASVGRAGVAQALHAASAAESGTEVSTAPQGAPVASLDAAVRAHLGAAFAGARTTAHLSGLSVAHTLVGRRSGGEDELAYLGFYDGLPGNAELRVGAWPRAGAGAVEVAVPETVARALGLRVGQAVSLVNRLDAGPLRVRLVGVYAVRDAAAAFWSGDPLETSGVVEGDYRSYGPLVVDRGAFQARLAGAGSTLRWRVELDPASVDPARLAALGAGVAGLGERLRYAPGAPTGVTSAQVSTELPALLARVDRALAVSAAAVLLPVLQLGLLAAMGVLLGARLLLGHREVEADLLRARGASRRQVAGWAVREALVLVVPAALLAPLLGGLLLGALDGAPVLRRAGVSLPAAPGGPGWAAAGGVAALCALALLVPLLRPAGTWAEGQQARARPRAATALQRSGVDLALLVLAVLAYLRLRDSLGPFGAGLAGRAGADPVLVAAPVLLLLAGVVTATRLVPLLGGAGERLARRGRGLPLAFAAWQVGRRSGGVTGPVVLVVLAVAVGALSTGYAASLARAQEDQAAFRTGADLRAVPPPFRVTADPHGMHRAYAALPGVRAALPALRERLSVGAGAGTALVLDAERAGAVLAVRRDLADGAVGPLLARAAAARPRPATAALPAGTRRLVVTLSGEVRFDASRTVRVSVAVRDPGGQLAVLPLGPLALDGRSHELGLDLARVGADTPAPGPLDLLAVEAASALPPDALVDFTLVLHRVATSTGAGPVVPLPASPWRAQAPAAANAALDSIEARAVPPPGGGLAAARVLAGQEGGSGTARVLFAVGDLTRAVPGTVPGVASRSLLALAGLGAPGGARSLDARVGPLATRVEPVAVLTEVPTLVPGEPGLVLDLPTVALARYLALGEPTTGEEWFLATNGGPAAAAALGSDPGLAERVHDRVAAAQEAREDPLTAGVLGALALAVPAAGVLAVIGLAASVAATARARAGELGVLRAVGLSGRQLTGVLLVEQAFLVLVGVGIGLALGAVLARLVVPLVLLGPDAARPVPAVVVETPWAGLALPAGLVAAALLLVVAALAMRLRRQGVGAALRLGEGR